MRRSSTAWELESGSWSSWKNPNAQTRSPNQFRNPNDESTRGCFSSFGFRHSSLIRISDFGFRHYPKIQHPVSSSQTRCFGTPLIPDHLRRYSTRPVSYYALFKWWLLLSQHPGCLCRITSYRTKQSLGTLAGGLGCFPLDREDYPSRTHSPDSLCGIRSLVGACRRVAPRLLSVALPPQS